MGVNTPPAGGSTGGGTPPLMSVAAGSWYHLSEIVATGSGGASGVADSTSGRAWLGYHPWLPGVNAIASLGLEVTGAGTAGSTMRLGIYAAGTSGLHSTFDALVGGLLFDSGPLATDTAGVKSSTGLNIALPKAGLWLLYVGQGLGVTPPTTRTIGGFWGPPVPANANNDARNGFLTVSGIAAALPATLPAGLANGAAVIGWFNPNPIVQYQ